MRRTRTIRTTRMTRTILAVLVAVAGLLLVSCGDDDDDDGGAARGEISKDEFIEQANAICAEGEVELDEALGEIDFTEMSEEEIADLLVDEFVPNVRNQLDEIRDLGFPEGDEDELDAILDDAKGLLDDVEDDPTSIFSGGDPFTDIDQRLLDYGLTNCAEDS